ncbi:MAG TPA: ABC transporter ATP-binding protein [Rhodospirillales bacterium]|nr:ABC transporter ATP-binding protein [Rhodospirillales bacterium]
MVELFADLPPEHEYFRQFSFIDPERLPQYRALIQRVDPDRPESMEEEDQRRLLALAFRLIPARHRLGLLTPEVQERVVEARRRFRANLPPELEGTISFFDRDAYNDALSIQENVIFGKIAYGQPNAAARVAELIARILDELDLALGVSAVGLDFECGVGGSRLNLSQRQKLAIARELLKRPQMLILHNATDALDASEQAVLRDAILEEFRGRTIFWVLNQHDWASRFDKVLVMDGGRVSAFARFEQLRDSGSAVGKLLANI